MGAMAVVEMHTKAATKDARYNPQILARILNRRWGSLKRVLGGTCCETVTEAGEIKKNWAGLGHHIATNLAALAWE